MEAIHNKDVKKEAPKSKVEAVKPEPTPTKEKEVTVSIDEYGNPSVEITYMGKRRRVHPDLVDKEKYKRDMELVKGKFKFHEHQRGTLLMSWAPTHLGAKPKKYSFVDGEVYEIPRALAEHLQERGKYPIHAHLKDDNGRPSQRVGEWVDRFDFYLIGNIHTKLPTKKIITVENL